MFNKALLKKWLLEILGGGGGEVFRRGGYGKVRRNGEGMLEDQKHYNSVWVSCGGVLLRDGKDFCGHFFV